MEFYINTQGAIEVKRINKSTYFKKLIHSTLVIDVLKRLVLRNTSLQIAGSLQGAHDASLQVVGGFQGAHDASLQVAGDFQDALDTLLQAAGAFKVLTMPRCKLQEAFKNLMIPCRGLREDFDVPPCFAATCGKPSKY